MLVILFHYNLIENSNLLLLPLNNIHLKSVFILESLFAKVGSYSYDDNRMLFDVSTLGYIQQSQSITLDYKVKLYIIMYDNNGNK